MFIVTACELLSHYTLIMDYIQLNPAIVHVDFELAAMKVLKEIFCNVSIKYYRFHLVQEWWGQIQRVGVSQEYKRFKSEISMLP